MANRDEALKDYEAGLSYKEIASKYGVSENTIKSWASRYWNKSKGATKARKKSQRKEKAAKKAEKVAKDTTKRKVGGQPGNQNAAGKDSGAPKGNKNNLKHGGYSAIYWDTLSDEEKELIDLMPKSEEELLLDQLKMFSVRERRLLIAIKNTREKSKKGGLSIYSVHIQENKRNFHGSKENEELYKERVAQKVADGERMPGDNQTVTSISENVENVILRLEKELTSVQKAKQKCLDTLFRLHIETEKLELLKENNNNEIEDTDDTDEVIYGKKNLL